MISNPEYEEAEFEVICLDAHGDRMPEWVVCFLYGQPKAPRYRILANGAVKWVAPFLPEQEIK